MSIELFDIVDRKDRVIGTTDKKTAHETGQLHRVAAVLFSIKLVNYTFRCIN